MSIQKPLTKEHSSPPTLQDAQAHFPGENLLPREAAGPDDLARLLYGNQMTMVDHQNCGGAPCVVRVVGNQTYTDQAGGLHAILVTAAEPVGSNATHGARATVGMSLLSHTAKGWALEFGSPNVATLGTWGHAPEVTIINGGIWGKVVVAHLGTSGQGISAVSWNLFVPDRQRGAWVLGLSLQTEHDNSGSCGDTAACLKDDFKTTLNLKTEQDGITVVANTSYPPVLQRANETKTFHVTEHDLGHPMADTAAASNSPSSAASPIVKAAPDYLTYKNARFKYSVLYPSTYVMGREAENGDGVTITSPNGKVTIAVYGGYNAVELTVAETTQDADSIVVRKGQLTYKHVIFSDMRGFPVSNLSRADKPDAVGTVIIQAPVSLRMEFDSLVREVPPSMRFEPITSGHLIRPSQPQAASSQPQQSVIASPAPTFDATPSTAASTSHSLVPLSPNSEIASIYGNWRMANDPNGCTRNFTKFTANTIQTYLFTPDMEHSLNSPVQSSSSISYTARDGTIFAAITHEDGTTVLAAFRSLSSTVLEYLEIMKKDGSRYDGTNQSETIPALSTVTVGGSAFEFVKCGQEAEIELSRANEHDVSAQLLRNKQSTEIRELIATDSRAQKVFESQWALFTASRCLYLGKDMSKPENVQLTMATHYWGHLWASEWPQDVMSGLIEIASNEAKVGDCSSQANKSRFEKDLEWMNQ